MFFADRVLESATNPGTGNVTLAGAVTGYRTFNAAIGTEKRFWYCIESSPQGSWEVGEGYLSASTTMVRSKLIASSTGSTVNFTGSVKVFLTVPAVGTKAGGIGKTYGVSRNTYQL